MTMAVDHPRGLPVLLCRIRLPFVDKSCRRCVNLPEYEACLKEREQREQARRERASAYPEDSTVIRLDQVEAELDELDRRVCAVVGKRAWVAALQ